MSKTMATRGLANTKAPIIECTEFTLHVSQQSGFSVVKKKLIDYTEYRLVRYAKSVIDAQQKLVLFALIEDYRNGHVAVAWRSGLPVHIKVTKDKG